MMGLSEFFKGHVAIDWIGKVLFPSGIIMSVGNKFAEWELNDFLTSISLILGILYATLKIIGWFQDRKKKAGSA